MSKKNFFLLNTGGSGFLGQHLVRILQEKDDLIKEIRIVDLQPYQNRLGKTIQPFI